MGSHDNNNLSSVRRTCCSREWKEKSEETGTLKSEEQKEGTVAEVPRNTRMRRKTFKRKEHKMSIFILIRHV